jgi:type II secretory pathway component PulC
MRALQIALGVACLAVVYAGLAPVLKVSSISATRLPPIEAPPARDASPERYAVIGARNLFRTREAAPLGASVEEDLKESQLQLKLCGTYAATPVDRSVACIENQGDQKRRAFRVGQEISAGVRLVAVERRRAVIDNRGAREQLTMEEVPGAGAITPVYSETGQFDGVKLTGIRPAGPFAGLAENTVCFELNGAKLDGVQALPQALMSGSTGQACLRCRQPDGVETMRCL